MTKWSECNMGVLLIMIFLHIVDDYYLQGILANMKQKDWWNKNSPQLLYRYDYLWALIMHSFSWTFMIMLPIMYLNNFEVSHVFMAIFIFNTIIHGFTDNLKANVKQINLIQDQIIHIIQIIITWWLLFY